MNILDIIIIAVLVIFGIAGYKKGLVGSLVGFVSLIAAIVLAWILYPIASDMLVGLGVRDYIYNLVLQRVNPEGLATAEAMPGFVANIVSGGADTAAVQITGRITDIILDIIAFLVVLIVSRIIIFIAEKVLKIVVKLPVLNWLNKLGGLVTGLLKGALIIYIISMLLFAVSPVKEESEIVKGSYFMDEMMDKNPVVDSIIDDNLKTEQSGE